MFGLKTRQLLFLAVIAVLIFAATQFVPMFFQVYQFSDEVHQIVKFAVSSRKSVDKIRSDILVQAKEYAIPIGPRDVRITRHGPAFTVEIDYQLPLNLRVYKRQMNWHVLDSGEIFEK